MPQPFFDIQTLGKNAPPDSSFAHRTPAEVRQHLQRTKYGDFSLPDAIRPSFDLQIIPREGWRQETYVDDVTEEATPVLRGAVSREQLIDVFYEMIGLVGDTANVVLETSHVELLTKKDFHYYYREEIDLPVLKSILIDYEDFLLADGCTGIAVLHPYDFVEIHLDEHKLLTLYAKDISDFEQIFQKYSIPLDPRLQILTDAEHVHVTRDEYAETFQKLTEDLGMEAF